MRGNSNVVRRSRTFHFCTAISVAAPPAPSLSLSPFFSYPLVCFSNLFLSYSLNPLHLFSPPISYPRPFRAFSSSFRSFHHPFLSIFFSPTPKIARSSRGSFRPRSFFQKRSSETSLFLPKFSLPMEFSMYQLKIKCGYALSLGNLSNIKADFSFRSFAS